MSQYKKYVSPSKLEAYHGKAKAIFEAADANVLSQAKSYVDAELEEFSGQVNEAIDVLSGEIDSKANATHKHAISDVNDLQSALDSKAGKDEVGIFRIIVTGDPENAIFDKTYEEVANAINEEKTVYAALLVDNHLMYLPFVGVMSEGIYFALQLGAEGFVAVYGQDGNGFYEIIELAAEDFGADPVGSAGQALLDAKDYTDEQFGIMENGIAEIVVPLAEAYEQLPEVFAAKTHDHEIRDVSGLQGKLDSLTDHTNNKSNPHGITKSQLGLGNVDNTADSAKPVSTAQASAIADAKKAGTDAQGAINGHIADLENPHSVTKAQVGLGNVDNTSDANKPVSTAQATAIADAKKAGTDAQSSITAHKDNKSNPHGVTAAQVGADPAGSASAVQGNLDTVEDKVDDHIAATELHFTQAERNKLSGIEANANKYTHPSSGVSAGTYRSVTVNAQGHVTAGSNPTTLAGYGITDAEAKGTVNTHNASTTAHSDIRDSLTALSNQLNAFLDVDDATRDELSEVLALIDANKGTLESLTTSKVNVTDIVNNLTTNVSNKPLSAAQGVSLKSLIDGLDSNKVDKVSGKGLSTNDYTTAEKTKLSGIATGAEVNQNAFSNVIVGSTTIAADSKTDSLTLVGSNVTITPDATNDKLTFSVADGTTSAKGLVKLTDSTSSTDTTTAATPNSVKSAYDLANTAKTNAGSAQTKADSAYDLANTANTQANTNKTNMSNHTGNTSNPHSVTKAQVGLGNVPNVATNDQTPTYTAASANAELVSGEKMSVAFGKLAKAVSSLISHLSNTSNPHSVTKAQVGLGNVDNTADANKTVKHAGTATSAETLTGLTSTVAELNVLDGITATTAELNYVDGVTSNIQTQLNGKASTSVATTSANGLMSSSDKSKLNGIAEGANNYTLPTAGATVLGGVKIGSNISISDGKISVPVASGSAAGVTIVYPAASCTTFSSDSGTVTPLAVQKGAKMFAITRPSSTTNKAITRYSNTTGDVQDSKILIEDVTNSKDSSKKAQVISIPAEGGKKMVYGYCTDQVDGTSFIGGVFDADATSFPYAAGLAIGGTSGNLLWKGSKVAVTSEIPTKVSQLTNDSGFKTTDTNTTYTISKSGSTVTLTGSDGSTTSFTDANTTYSAATQSAAGLMSAADKTKLDGLSDSGGGAFSFDALIDAPGYTYSYVKSTGVETIKSGSTTYATRTSTKNSSTGVWTVQTVCSAAGVNVKKTYTPSSTGWTSAIV